MEGGVGIIKIKCPTTGKLVSTGIETDLENFERLPEVNASMLCPACGQTHQWSKSKAWHCDAGPSGPPDAS
jgi:hypothetical protein